MSSMTTAVAKQKTGEGERADELLLVSFWVCGSLFALDAGVVQEVIRVAAPTRLFRAPEDVVGVINLRGRIVTVLDLANRLGLGRHTPGPENRVFILENRREHVGLLVDRVADVVEVARTALKPSPANVAGEQGRFFNGVFHSGEHLITLLDSARVLSDEESR
jgi:purine-binding chemotaxis protein CheW